MATDGSLDESGSPMEMTPDPSPLRTEEMSENAQHSKVQMPPMKREVERFSFESLSRQTPVFDMLQKAITAKSKDTPSFTQKNEDQQGHPTMKLSADILHAFADEIGHTKKAWIGDTLSRVGGAAIRGAGKAAKTLGVGKGFGKVVGKGVQAAGGGAGLRKAVGGGVIGVGALGAGAALS